MADELVDVSDTAALVDELRHLRGEVDRLQERIQFLDKLAHEDWLIELPNRRGFMRQLEMLISRVARHGDSAAMLFVDVDGLKMINDCLGHLAGDEALCHVARLLVEGVRKGDCVARLGGDEFGILLEHADEQSAVQTAQRIADMIAEGGFQWQDTLMPLSVAIGVSAIQPDDEPETVIMRADEAMYREKAAA